jgi:hypothetical protein
MGEPTDGGSGRGEAQSAKAARFEPRSRARQRDDQQREGAAGSLRATR